MIKPNVLGSVIKKGVQRKTGIVLGQFQLPKGILT